MSPSGLNKKKNKYTYIKKTNRLFDLNKAYFEKDNPIVSDLEFDNLKKEIITLSKKYPFLKKIKNTESLVGHKPSSKFEKIKHSNKALKT